MYEIGRMTKLELGYVGEENSRVIEIDVSEWKATWPDAVIAIWLTNPVNKGYWANTEEQDGVLRWTIGAGDVEHAGEGMAQVRAIVPGGDGAIYKARIVRTKIAASLDDMEQDEDAPDPMETWANKAAAYKDEAYRAMETAVEAEESVAASADAAKENAEAARRSAESADEDANDADSSAKAAAESARVAAKRAKEAASSASMLKNFVPSVTEGTKEWLDMHPEATTTVQDKSLSEKKLTEDLRKLAENRSYRKMTPSFGWLAT